MTPNGKQRFEAHQAMIEELIRTTACRHHLGKDDFEELYSYVMMRLIDKDYDILKRFAGRSSLRTFLVTVVSRLTLDFKNRYWGRWRPSAVARRLGPVGIHLEVLLFRDERSLEEAVEILVTNFRVPMARDELRRLAGSLPCRPPRHFENDGCLDQMAADDDVEARARGEERSTTARRAATVLQQALDRLPAQDGLILKLRFYEGLTVPRIAEELQLRQRYVYGRVERCLRQLRTWVVDQGLSREDVADIDGRESAMIRLCF